MNCPDAEIGAVTDRPPKNKINPKCGKIKDVYTRLNVC